MDEDVKEILLVKDISAGFGFSIIGGKGSCLPPVICDILEDSPADKCGQIDAGDVLLEVNGDPVTGYTTKKVLNRLKASGTALRLKLRDDPKVKRRAEKFLFCAPEDNETLSHVITQDELQGVSQLIVKSHATPTPKLRRKILTDPNGNKINNDPASPELSADSNPTSPESTLSPNWDVSPDMPRKYGGGGGSGASEGGTHAQSRLPVQSGIRPPSTRAQAAQRKKSDVDLTSPFVRHNSQESDTSMKSPSRKSGRKFETFVMTGEMMIRTTSETNDNDDGSGSGDDVKSRGVTRKSSADSLSRDSGSGTRGSKSAKKKKTSDPAPQTGPKNTRIPLPNSVSASPSLPVKNDANTFPNVVPTSVKASPKLIKKSAIPSAMGSPKVHPKSGLPSPQVQPKRPLVERSPQNSPAQKRKIPKPVSHLPKSSPSLLPKKSHSSLKSDNKDLTSSDSGIDSAATNDTSAVSEQLLVNPSDIPCTVSAMEVNDDPIDETTHSHTEPEVINATKSFDSSQESIKSQVNNAKGEAIEHLRQSSTLVGNNMQLPALTPHTTNTTTEQNSNTSIAINGANDGDVARLENPLDSEQDTANEHTMAANQGVAPVINALPDQELPPCRSEKSVEQQLVNERGPAVKLDPISTVSPQFVTSQGQNSPLSGDLPPEVQGTTAPPLAQLDSSLDSHSEENAPIIDNNLHTQPVTHMDTTDNAVDSIFDYLSSEQLAENVHDSESLSSKNHAQNEPILPSTPPTIDQNDWSPFRSPARPVYHACQAMPITLDIPPDDICSEDEMLGRLDYASFDMDDLPPPPDELLQSTFEDLVAEDETDLTSLAGLTNNANFFLSMSPNQGSDSGGYREVELKAGDGNDKNERVINNSNLGTISPHAEPYIEPSAPNTSALVAANEATSPENAANSAINKPCNSSSPFATHNIEQPHYIPAPSPVAATTPMQQPHHHPLGSNINGEAQTQSVTTQEQPEEISQARPVTTVISSEAIDSLLNTQPSVGDNNSEQIIPETQLPPSSLREQIVAEIVTEAKQELLSTALDTVAQTLTRDEQDESGNCSALNDTAAPVRVISEDTDAQSDAQSDNKGNVTSVTKRTEQLGSFIPLSTTLVRNVSLSEDTTKVSPRPSGIPVPGSPKVIERSNVKVSETTITSKLPMPKGKERLDKVPQQSVKSNEFAISNSATVVTSQKIVSEPPQSSGHHLTSNITQPQQPHELTTQWSPTNQTIVPPPPNVNLTPSTPINQQTPKQCTDLVTTPDVAHEVYFENLLESPPFSHAMDNSFTLGMLSANTSMDTSFTIVEPRGPAGSGQHPMGSKSEALLENRFKNTHSDVKQQGIYDRENNRGDSIRNRNQHSNQLTDISDTTTKMAPTVGSQSTEQTTATKSGKKKRGMVSSKSAEKITPRNRNAAAASASSTTSNSSPMCSRNSKSQENYLDNETMKLIDIDFEDNIASSVDVLHYENSTTSLEKLAGGTGSERVVHPGYTGSGPIQGGRMAGSGLTADQSRSLQNSPERRFEQIGDKILMPTFISINESSHPKHNDELSNVANIRGRCTSDSTAYTYGSPAHSSKTGSGSEIGSGDTSPVRKQAPIVSGQIVSVYPAVNESESVWIVREADTAHVQPETASGSKRNSREIAPPQSVSSPPVPKQKSSKDRKSPKAKKKSSPKHKKKGAQSDNVNTPAEVVNEGKHGLSESSGKSPHSHDKMPSSNIFYQPDITNNHPQLSVADKSKHAAAGHKSGGRHNNANVKTNEQVVAPASDTSASYFPLQELKASPKSPRKRYDSLPKSKKSAKTAAVIEPSQGGVVFATMPGVNHMSRDRAEDSQAPPPFTCDVDGVVGSNNKQSVSSSEPVSSLSYKQNGGGSVQPPSSELSSNHALPHTSGCDLPPLASVSTSHSPHAYGNSTAQTYAQNSASLPLQQQTASQNYVQPASKTTKNHIGSPGLTVKVDQSAAISPPQSTSHSKTQPLPQDTTPFIQKHYPAAEPFVTSQNRVTSPTKSPPAVHTTAHVPPPPGSNPPQSPTEVVSSNPPSPDYDADSIYHQPLKDVDIPSAKRLAKRLFHLEGFKKSDISKHLSKKNEFAQQVGEEFLQYFDFSGQSLDEAVRVFLQRITLAGETQERERVLVHFSRRYVQTNPGSFHSEDACHTLLCALLLLNTDLHNQNIGRKMSVEEFIENLSGLNDGDNFPRDMLSSLYASIKNKPLEMEFDSDSDTGAPDFDLLQTAGPGHGAGVSRVPGGETQRYVGHNPFLEVPDPNKGTEYKKGFVMRKCCIEPDGRKTPVGKRAWKMFYAVLKDMVLYLHKDEHAYKKNAIFDNMSNAIRVHHSFAVKATDYKKKQHVFRVNTADSAEYLFQTGNPEECQKWIDAINTVAATLSAPPLPSAVGSQRRFQKPLLPAGFTRYNAQEQLQHHEQRLSQIERDLHEHRKYPPEKGAKARLIQEYVDKEQYLQFEAKRFKTYCFLLRNKLTSFSPELEPSLVETAICEVSEPPSPSTEHKECYTFSVATVTTTVATTDDDHGKSRASPESSRSRRSGVGARSVTDRAAKHRSLPESVLLRYREEDPAFYGTAV